MYCSDLIEIKRIVLVMFLRKIRTSFDCVKYLNLFVLYCVCSFTLFSSTAIFERDRLLYYNILSWMTVSEVWAVFAVAAWPRWLMMGGEPSTGHHHHRQSRLSWVLAVSAGGRESSPLPRSTTAPQHRQTRAWWSWKIDCQPGEINVNVQWFVESDRFDIRSEVKTLSVDIVTDSSPCSRLLPFVR